MDSMTLAVGLAILSLLAALASLVVLMRLRDAWASAPEPERLGARALREPPEDIEAATRPRRRSRLPPALVARLMTLARRR